MRAELFDAGTTLNIVPPSSASRPGMDEAYFRALDMEHQFQMERQDAMNDLIREAPLRTELRPWPIPFPGRCWIDWSDRLEGADGGLQIETFRHDMTFDEYEPAVGRISQVVADADYDPNVDLEDERMHDTLTVQEIQAQNPDPQTWLRLPLRNEPGGKEGHNCELGPAAVLVQDRHEGDAYRIKVNYSPLYAPLDLTHPEWYDVIRADGSEPEYGRKAIYDLRPDGNYRLYLRPANWRWVATVWATYIYATWFEMYYVRYVFTYASFDRPPIYPRRHDLIHTTQTATYPYENNYYSYDQGISGAWDMSKSAAFLRFQIVDQQWFTLSEALTLVNNDPATLAMWLWPPNAGDIVAGIGIVDGQTRDEEVLWLRQNRDLTSVYPRTVIGSYIVPEFVAY